jgi:hypothetical protein
MPLKPVKKTDTLLFKSNYSDSFNYPHIFKQHRLASASRITSVDKIPHKEAWPSYFLFLGLALLIFSFISILKKHSTLIKSCYSLKAARTLEREEFRLTGNESLFMSLLYVLTFSFLVFKLNIIYGFYIFSFATWLQYLLVFSLAIILYTVKFLVLRITGNILSVEREAEEYRFNIFITSHIAGMFFLIFCFTMEFIQIPIIPVIITSIGGFVLFYLLRILKGLLIAREIKGLSVFQLFIYLCTMEFLPLAVIVVFVLRLGSYF